MDVLPQFCVVVLLVVVVVATVTDLLQPSVPWLHLNLSIATLFVLTGGPPQKCSLVALKLEQIVKQTETNRQTNWNKSIDQLEQIVKRTGTI
jgi:hypothetical protein